MRGRKSWLVFQHDDRNPVAMRNSVSEALTSSLPGGGDGIRIEVVTARLEAAIVVTDFQLDPLRNQAWRYGIIIMRASSMLYFLQNLFPEMNSALYFEMGIFFFWIKDNYEGNSLKIAFFFFRLNSF